MQKSLFSYVLDPLFGNLDTGYATVPTFYKNLDPPICRSELAYLALGAPLL